MLRRWCLTLERPDDVSPLAYFHLREDDYGGE
jgi:hypothetical protein